MTTQHTTTGAADTTAARYTPGPWGTYRDASGYQLLSRSLNRNNVFGRFRPHLGDHAPCEKANARLITAAPELFDIASALVSHAESIAETYGDDAPLTGGIVELALRARAVVNEVNQPA